MTVEEQKETTEIEIYDAPMKDEQTKFAECCGVTHVGIREGDKCRICGSVFVMSEEDVNEENVDFSSCGEEGEDRENFRILMGVLLLMIFMMMIFVWII